MPQNPHLKLPHEAPTQAGWKDIVICWLGVVVVVAMVNAGARWYLNHYTTNHGYMLIREKWQLLRDMNGPVDWLILGDSSGNQGIMPSVFNERFGGKAVNLCTIGDTLAMNDAWMLEEYIQRFGSPKHVVIVHVYDIWWRGVKHEVLAQIPLGWRFWTKVNPRLEFGLVEEATLFMNQYSPFYSEHKTLGHIIRSPELWFDSQFHFEADGFTIVDQARPDLVRSDMQTHIQFTHDHRFNMSHENQTAMDHITTLANRYGFEVFLANSPIYNALTENEDFQRYFKEVQSSLSNWAAKSDRTHYLLREPMGFTEDQMQNADHVIESSAVAYSLRLVEEIARRQAVDR